MSTTTIISIIGVIVSVIGIIARLFFFRQGKKIQELEHEKEKNERLSNRPRTDVDVINRLQQWKDKLSKRKP